MTVLLRQLFLNLAVVGFPFFALAEEALHLANEEIPLAAEGGHHHAAAIPVSVTYQVINFAIYLAILVYFLRHPIKEFFRSREEVYKQALIRAESAKNEAEVKKREIQQRLRDLDASTEQSIESARAEATTLKRQIKEDAEKLAGRLREEAARSAELEVERARGLLREEILEQSFALSRKLLSDKIAEGDQKRLQTEFVEKIQEVR